MPESALLLIDRPFEGAVVLTLNRPLAMNALSRALRVQLTAAFRNLAQDPSARVVVLTGAGRAFCAGLDLKELGAQPATIGLTGDVDVLGAMNAFTGPIIGAINGPAITGGFELALACDLMVASPQARFADTHARVGIMPGWGLSQKLSRLIGLSRAKELSLTGNFLSAEQALAWGLVNHVVHADQLLPKALALAADMLSALPEMLVAYKRVIDQGFATTLGAGLALETAAHRAWVQTMDPAALEVRRTAVRERGQGQLATAKGALPGAAQSSPPGVARS